MTTERNKSPNQSWILGQIDDHVSQDPLELDYLYDIDIEGPLPERETDSTEPVAVPPILTSVERSHLLETLDANNDSVMFGIENYIQDVNIIVRINITALISNSHCTMNADLSNVGKADLKTTWKT